MDLHNREILAYTISSKQDTKFVLDTLNQIDLPKDVLLHSDQGSVYTSAEYYNLCKEKGIIHSMSRKGTPADNVPIESFHSSLKCEAFYIKDEVITLSSIVIQSVEHYIKYYNEKRIQQKLDYCLRLNIGDGSPRVFLFNSHFLGSPPSCEPFFVCINRSRESSFYSTVYFAKIFLSRLECGSMVITKIEAQKKKGRYNIYLNDVFAFGVDEATVVKYTLFKGTELTKEQIDEIQHDDCIQQAYQKALHFLNFKLRSTKEVYEKLEKLEFDEDIINEVLGKLREQNFINDTFYAESYLNQAKFVTFKGPKSVVFDLQKKGISDKLIQTVLEGYTLREQLENAIQIAQSYLKGQKRVTPKVAKQKVKVFVMQKGYSKEIAEEVAPFLSFEAQSEMEAELAVKEIATIYRRIAKKYEENESALWYQIKGKLYQKGFTSSAIEQAIAQFEMEKEEWI